MTEDTWDEEALEAVKKNGSDLDGFSVYAASKTEAEKAVWEAVRATKPPFQVSAVSRFHCRFLSLFASTTFKYQV